MTFRESFRNMTWDDISRMSDKELKSTLRSVQKLVNQDLKKVKSVSDGQAPAVRGLEESGGKITTRGNRGEMLKELNRGRKFLYSKTGTITGWRQYEAKTAKIVKGYENWTKDQRNDFWDFVDKFRNDETKKGLYAGIGSGPSIAKLNEIYRSGTLKAEDVEKEMTSYYEETKEREFEDFSTRRFFS